MGVVYEVQDLARREIVALKTLRHGSPAGVYRLKHEFRSLAGVAHPNVVCLYELVVEEARCFFTMELVPGVNFVEYVRGTDRTHLSIERLRSALRQLVDGVSALHRMGKLHRDIKPSNVLVTPEGRVVILDFGLITELFPDNLGAPEHVIGGTPAYVAPEDGSDFPPSEAGDWYSVGATLYEALTGEIPFRGPPIDNVVVLSGRVTSTSRFPTRRSMESSTACRATWDCCRSRRPKPCCLATSWRCRDYSP
jgi:serine/threonine protein kinase